jgi:3-oxoacyl-[acyl-carrier protein] reductase
VNTIDLKGRTAVITGGARCIDYAAARKMLASGAAVALWDIDAAALAKAVGSLTKGGRIHTAVVELTDEADVRKAVDTLIRDAGKIDILVNNAGITGGNAPLWELKPRCGGA